MFHFKELHFGLKNIFVWYMGVLKWIPNGLKIILKCFQMAPNGLPPSPSAESAKVSCQGANKLRNIFVLRMLYHFLHFSLKDPVLVFCVFDICILYYLFYFSLGLPRRHEALPLLLLLMITNGTSPNPFVHLFRVPFCSSVSLRCRRYRTDHTIFRFIHELGPRALGASF